MNQSAGRRVNQRAGRHTSRTKEEINKPRPNLGIIVDAIPMGPVVLHVYDDGRPGGGGH
jgi:hypothetical protein